MSADSRLDQLTDWIQQDWPEARIEVASADASFRRYFRITPNPSTSGISYIAMDAPPQHENCAPFIDITGRLRNAGVHAPEVIRQDLQQGFLLLEDLGNTPYLSQLSSNPDLAETLYGSALETLTRIQSADTSGLPEYDETRLMDEMKLMPKWFLDQHLNIRPDPEQQKIIDRTLAVITALVQQQPQGFVHRDYHSRNLMLLSADLPTQAPGVIDYQDAVRGPLTYDLVSILRDCYIHWPLSRITRWALDYKQRLEKAGAIDQTRDETFIQWFDIMGLQRHLKVLGIFARLHHRDGKSGYLEDLPLTLSYVMSVGVKYPLIKPLIDLFEEWQIPQTIGLVQISK